MLEKLFPGLTVYKAPLRAGPFRGHAFPKSTMKPASPYDLEKTCPSKMLPGIGGLFMN
jgi:hypothetical protein